MNCPEYIPAEIAEKAIKLEFNEIAWERNELIRLLNHLQKIGKGIWGIDVYTQIDGNVDTLGAGGANWASDEKEGESSKDFQKRSIIETLKYLEKLPPKDEYIYSVTFYGNAG